MRSSPRDVMSYEEMQKNRREFLIAGLKFALAGTFASAFACKRSSSGSEVLLFTDDYYSCTAYPDTAKIQRVGNVFSSRVKSGFPQKTQELFNEMAKLPDHYLDFLARSPLQIEIVSSIGNGIAGWCSASSMGGRGGVPYEIQLGAEHVSGGGTALHELGHGLNSFLFDQYRAQGSRGGDPLDLLQTTYNAVLSSAEAANVGWYAKTEPVEFWAELFSSFFCNGQTNQHLAQVFPRSYEFASAFMALPNSAPMQNPPGNPQQQQVAIGNPQQIATPQQGIAGNNPGNLLASLLQGALSEFFSGSQGTQSGLGLTEYSADKSQEKFLFFGPAYEKLYMGSEIAVSIASKNLKQYKNELSTYQVYFAIEGGQRSRQVTQLQVSQQSDELAICRVELPSLPKTGSGIRGFVNKADLDGKSAKLILADSKGKVLAERSGYKVIDHHLDLVKQRINFGRDG